MLKPKRPGSYSPRRLVLKDGSSRVVTWIAMLAVITQMDQT